MPAILQSIVVRWLIATVSFPLGGVLGNAIAGPADSIGSGLLAGILAGAVIGLGQGLALGLRPPALVAWAASTALGLGIGLAVMIAITGPIGTTGEATLLGLLCGVLIGVAQGALLQRRGANPIAWTAVVAVAWAAGWFVTTSIGVSLDPGWAVYGMAGAITSQVITLVGLYMFARPATVIGT